MIGHIFDKEAEERIAVPVAPAGSAKHAGQAGGRGGRVIRRQDSLHGKAIEGEGGGEGGEKQISNDGPTEADRAEHRKIITDTQNLLNWFTSDAADANVEISLSDLTSACEKLDVAFSSALSKLCENNDLSTSVRAINLLQNKSKSVIATLDGVKKRERDKLAAERRDRKLKKEREKQAKKDAELKLREDAKKILEIEASIILHLDRGGLTNLSSDKVGTETRFYRYDDHGLQFSFGSADFTGLVLMPDGTFTFQNGYKMEFSSARQFKEQSEGLFDDLEGTYDILWGEMREEKGKVVRRLPSQATIESAASTGPNRPGLGDKKRSSRMFLGGVKDTLVRMQSKMKLGREKSSMKLGREKSVRMQRKESSRGEKIAGGGGTTTKIIVSPSGIKREVPVIGSPNGGTRGGEGEGGEEGGGEEEDVFDIVPLEIILHPVDAVARRKGIDLTQRWGCFPPDKDKGDKVVTIQRKFTPTPGPGEEYVFPLPITEEVLQAKIEEIFKAKQGGARPGAT